MIKNDDDRVVFFDVAGTLLDTSDFAETARKAAIGLMVDNGLPLDKDEAYGVLKTIIREKGSNYGKHFNVLTQVVLGHEDPMLVALGMITYHNVKMALLRPFPETIDTLIYLKSQGYRLAVISNGITIKQWEKLVRLNIHSFFDEVITSEEVGKNKPNRLIYDVALRKMKGNPEKSLMIGNKFKEDALGAVNAGMGAVLVNSDITEDDRDYIKREKLDITVVDDIGDVLVIHLDGAAGHEVAVHHSRRLVLHDLTAGQTAPDRLENLLRIRSRLSGKGQRFRQYGDVIVHNDLVRQLRDAAAAGTADEQGRRTVMAEHFLLRQPEIRFVSAHHDGQGTTDGPFLSAGNRRIQESDAHFLQLVIALSGVRRRNRAVIDDQTALLHVLRHAVFAEINILYDRSIRKNGQNDIAGTSDLLIGAALRPQ